MLPNTLNQTPTTNGAGPYSAFGVTIFDRFRTLLGLDTKGTGFTLESIIGHYYRTWIDNQSYYTDLQNWYDGIPLDEQIENPITKVKVDKYPLHLNPNKDTS